MKSILAVPIVLILSISCGQNKAKQHQEAVNEMMEKYGDKNSPTTSTQQGKPPSAEVINSGLMGEWKVVLVTGDSNSNGKLDQEEIENGTKNYNDYLNLRPDGTCQYTQVKLEGIYEIVEKNGNRSIDIIAPDGSRISQGRIISIKEGELQLMKFSGGRDIIVYNRP